MDPRDCFRSGGVLAAICLLLVFLATGCRRSAETTAAPEESSAVALAVPRGYYRTLQIDKNGTLLRFGPFVGYYFRPRDPRNLDRLEFVCLNEDRFYASGMPDNARLFEGEAVFQTLPEADFEIPTERRIHPVFFPDAPPVWLDARPSPQEEFLHFHSCYHRGGAVRAGYWLRHHADTEFIVDMRGRVGPESPLFHEIRPGPVRNFARIIEFDQGPDFPQKRSRHSE